MAKMEFIHPGLFSSLQDLGRRGFRKLALPNGGAMDAAAMQRVNLILNNPPNTPVLECTQMGPVLSFSDDCHVVMSGAKAEVKLNSKVIEGETILEIRAGDILDLRKLISGNRLYLGIKNGFSAENNFGSCSRVSGLNNNERFEKSDLASYQTSSGLMTKNAILKSSGYFESTIVNCLPGPEFYLLSPVQKLHLERIHFKITPSSNRMAFKLEASTNYWKNEFSILTCPVIPGTIQLTPAGELIVLMRDAQTTGGYPRILVLPENSINQLAQIKINRNFSLKISSNF